MDITYCPQVSSPKSSSPTKQGCLDHHSWEDTGFYNAIPEWQTNLKKEQGVGESGTSDWLAGPAKVQSKNSGSRYRLPNGRMPFVKFERQPSKHEGLIIIDKRVSNGTSCDASHRSSNIKHRLPS